MFNLTRFSIKSSSVALNPLMEISSEPHTKYDKTIYKFIFAFQDNKNVKEQIEHASEHLSKIDKLILLNEDFEEIEIIEDDMQDKISLIKYEGLCTREKIACFQINLII